MDFCVSILSTGVLAGSALFTGMPDRKNLHLFMGVGTVGPGAHWGANGGLTNNLVTHSFTGGFLRLSRHVQASFPVSCAKVHRKNSFGVLCGTG